MGKVVFDTTEKESVWIDMIVARGVSILNEEYIECDTQSKEMDIPACHCNGCPLDFEKWLTFDDASFMHDFHGISRFIDRDTGRLTECFDPRCSK